MREKIGKLKKAVTGLLALILASVICWSGTPVYGEGAETAEQVELYRYITFYDAAGGDVNDTVGFHVKNLTGTVREGYIEAVVNEWPEALNLGETDGYPRVIINYGMNQGRQKDITEECDYDPGTGIVRIPDGYRGKFLTVKSVMSDSSSAYQLLVPEEYRVNKNLPMPMLSYEDGPADDTDWAVYGVIPGSCNDTAANGDISSYQVGDRIEIRSALVQTVARNTMDMEGTLDLYGELGMSEYRTGFGWTGFAVSLDCGERNPFTNIGNPGTGSSVRTFPGIGQIALNTRSWMYARCVTDDADHFSGNGRVTGGHIKVIGKDADGTLTCWMYLERTGPSGQAAQNVGMVFKVHPSEGSLEIRKSSALPELTAGNACYSLAGAEYTVYRAGTSEAVGQLVTDETGYGRLEGLPAGTYEVEETKAPQGYLLDEERRTVTVNSGETAVYACTDMPGNDPVQVLLVKRDAETGSPQAGARLEGAEYTVQYYDGIYSSDPAPEGKAAKRQWVFRTDGDGVILFDPEHRVSGDDFWLGTDGIPVLPLGTLTIQESKAPEGYLLNDTVYVANTTADGGKSVVTANLPNSEERPAEERIIRGDLEFTKVDADDQSPMSGIPFTLTSCSTGESHRIVTDENGYYSTAAGYVPHTQNTNRGISAEDGVWFGGGKPDDSLGALPYDTYLLEEQPCEANKGKDLVSLEVTVSRDDFAVDLGSIDNYTVELHTSAADTATGTKTVAPSGEASVTDTVTYRNLTAGRTYTMSGRLMVKETGEELISGGKPVTAEVEFVPETKNGTVDMTFVFDASDLAGQKLVAFEKLTWKGISVAAHEDLDDEGQTVYIPEIRTTAADRDTESHVGKAREDAVIVDTVEYSGLTPGSTYQVSGVLMNRETGEPLRINGREVSASRTFIPNRTDGTVKLYFRFDASGLAGRTVVVFEEVTYEGITVAVHDDIEDSSQSVSYPQIETTACDRDTGSHLGTVKEAASIEDMVSYENLIPGERYVLKGALMDRSTGEQLLSDGKPVTAAIEFVPEAPDGEKVLTYTFDSSALRGATVVVYESLYHNGVPVAAHQELADEKQTVRLPELKTEALDQDTGSHTGTLRDGAAITDLVNYSNLIPGQEYTLRGQLMVKETGEVLLMEGEPVTAETAFTAENSSGTAELVYELDSRGLEGKTIVVFEELLLDEVTLIRHADLEDEAQSVCYPALKTEATAYGSHEVMASGTVEIEDAVSYENLIPGKTYTLSGALMEKSTGKPLTVNGMEITAAQSFVPESPSGTVKMKFSFSADGLADRTVVAFEELRHNNVLVMAHADLNDEAQTVRFSRLPPKNRTAGSVPETGDTAGTMRAAVTLLGAGGAAGAFWLLKKRRRNR